MDENTLQATDVAEPSDSTNRCRADHHEDELALKIGRLCLRWMKLWLLLVGFLIVATIVTPPDAISQLTLAVMMAIVYGLTTIAVSRFKLLSDTPARRKTVLIFLFSVSVTLLVLYVPALWTR